MPPEPEQHTDPTPPRGVPRWLWPPPGAEVRAVEIVEEARVVEEAGVDGSATALASRIEGGAALEDRHLRALRWLLDEHPRAARPAAGPEGELRVRLEIATTILVKGRLGHAYALDGGPLGAPSADVARGVLWRTIEARVGT